MVRVGLIGLGNMGARMAVHLARRSKQKQPLAIYDASKDALRACAADPTTVTIHRDVQQLAVHSDVIVLMLPGPQAVRTVAAEVLDHATPGTLLIDCSTVDPATSRDVAADASARSCAFVDAPVSGGVVGAEAASLTFMVGAANDETFARAKPHLEVMGKRILRCGGVSAGTATKLCNNAALAVQMAGVAEAMHLGRALGLDPPTLAAALNSSSARSWSSDTYNPCPGVLENVPAARDYEGGFATSLMLKDLRLAVDAARGVGAALPAVEHAASLYADSEAREPGRDFSALFKMLESRRGSTP